MKKYYMSFVDFSEISNVTADEEQLKKSRDRMAELGLLTEKERGCLGVREDFSKFMIPSKN